MQKGSRCKHIKRASRFPHWIVVALLLLFGWAAGLGMGRLHIPIPAQIIILGLFTFMALRCKKTDQHQSQPASPPPTVDIPFDQTTPSSLNPHFAEQGLAESHTSHLQLLCASLQLTTAALLLREKDGDRYSLFAHYSTAPQTISHCNDCCSGVLLGLKDDRPEISGHPGSPKFKGLPYYKEGVAVGGFMATALKELDMNHPLAIDGFLCVDRSNATPWTENEKNIFHGAAGKIKTDLYVAEQLAQNNRDKKAINQICLALQDLNTVLNLKEAFTATHNTVTGLTPATVVAITLQSKNTHRVVSVTGLDDPSMEDMEINHDTCLVNQAMDFKRTMTPRPALKKPQTLFTTPSPLDHYQSLLIIPLIIDDKPIGTLIAGGQSADLFSKNQQALLEVIAGQIATRIDLAQTHEKIHHLATIDGLTGLVNHRTFQNGLAKMIDRAQRQQTTVTLILCDIDHFKRVNDTYGHPFGDEVLRQVSKVLKEAVRSVDLAARYGGEEFTLVLENADLEGGRTLAERTRREIAALRFNHKGEEVRITMSFGISSYPAPAENQADLISQADHALYTCKENGRNQTCCYT